MGEYLTKFTQVQNLLYQNKVEEAKTLLQSLLNDIYEVYKSTTNLKEKLTMEITMNKLIPALDDLKRNYVSREVKNILMLDEDKFEKESDSKVDSSFFDAIPLEEVPSEEEEDILEEVKEEEEDTNPFLSDEVPEEVEEESKPLRATLDNVLVPLTLEDYIGQEKAKRTLKVAIEASKIKEEVLAHIMISAPYGLGKTTLARIIANEMDLPFIEVNASSLKDNKALIQFFDNLKESSVLFIDEIHTLSKSNQTLLLSIMSEFALNYIKDDGEAVHKDLPKFTLIGASTQPGELLKPFLNRFSFIELVDYTDEEKLLMVKSKFNKLKYEIEEDALNDVSIRSRGIPRTMEIFAREIADLTLIKHLDKVTKEVVEEYFEMKDIDALGLTLVDLKILKALDESDRPLGLLTLESKCGIQKEDIEYRYEPYLIKLGLVEKTEKGRIITQKGKDYINPKEEDLEAPIIIEEDNKDEEDK